MKKWTLFLILIVLLTSIADSIIVWLALERVDWVVLVPASFSQAAPQHGKYTFSVFGFAAWTCILAVYAAAVVAIGRKMIQRPPGFINYWLVTVLLLISLLCLIAIVHPTFLLYITAGGFPPLVVRSLQRLGPLNDIYEHWGIARQAWWIITIQLGFAVLTALLQRKHTEVRD